MSVEAVAASDVPVAEPVVVFAGSLVAAAAGRSGVVAEQPDAKQQTGKQVSKSAKIKRHNGLHTKGETKQIIRPLVTTNQIITVS